MGSKLLAALLAILILFAFAVHFRQPSPPVDDSFKDYVSCGDYLRQQILDYRTETEFTYRMEESDGEPDIDQLWTEIRESMRTLDQDPFEGEHLFSRTLLHGPFTTVSHNRDKSTSVLFETSIEYYTSPQQEEELKKACAEVIQSLNIENSDDYQKIFAIYRYICDNIVYDYDHLEDSEYLLQYTAYAALCHKSAVCAGISDLLYCLGRLAGLETHITIYDDHAWNFIRLGDKYYYLDATWDLGKKPREYEYFLKGTKDFLNHDMELDDQPFVVPNFLSRSEIKYDISERSYQR